MKRFEKLNEAGLEEAWKKVQQKKMKTSKKRWPNKTETMTEIVMGPDLLWVSDI